MAVTSPLSMPFLALLLALSATPADAPNDVLLVSYQGAGRTPELAQRLLSSMADAISSRGFHPRPDAESTRQERAAAMCGEDGDCLATLGRRLEAAWVVGLGLGSVGKQTLISVLLVNVETGRVAQRFSRQVPTQDLDAATVSTDAVTQLFTELTPREKPTTTPPPIEPPVEVPIAALTPTAPPSRPLHSAAVGTTIAAGVLAAAGLGLSVGAGVHYGQLASTPPNARPDADSLQRALNTSADATVGVAVAAAVTAVVLFVLDGSAAQGPTP